MSKPQKNTPISYVIALLSALPEWHKEHRDALEDGLEEAFDAEATLTAAHDTLRATQTLFEREQKEDQEASINEDVLIAQGAALLLSVSKAAQAALRGHPERARLMRQFITAAPSDHRTASAMIEALSLASAGLTQHKELFKTRKKLHARQIKRAQELLSALQGASKLRKKERVETRAAQVARDEAQREALELVTTLDDAAQAVYFDDATPYNTLRTLYSVYCPAPPSPVEAGKDEIEGSNDPVEPGGEAG